MLKTFRSQILSCITLVMFVASAGIMLFTYADVKKDVQEREEKSVQNISHFIQLIIKNEYDELMEYKVDTIQYYKKFLKGMLKFTLHMYATSSDTSYEHWSGRFNQWFKSRSRDSSVEWLFIDKEGDVVLASDPSFNRMNVASFMDMKDKSIGSKLTDASLSRSGDCAVFYLDGEKQGGKRWKMAYFTPLNKNNMIISTSIDISSFIDSEDKKKEEVVRKIKYNLSKIKIANSGFIFIFDGKKNILIPPEVKHYSDFCKINQKDKCLDILMNSGREKKDGKIETDIQLSGSKQRFSIYTSYFKGFDWYISIVVPTNELSKPAHDLVVKLVVMILAVFIVCLALSVYLVSSATKPLEILSRQMEKAPYHDFTASDHSELLDSLPGSANNEIGQLAQTFGFMISKLAANIQQLVETTASNERIEGELNAAREIQLGVLPKDFSFEPERKALDIYAYLIPARELGGDLYDFFFIDDDNLCFTIGDVAGKGVPAALFMLTAKKYINNTAHQERMKPSPAEIMNQMNVLFCKDNPECTFITLLIGILNVKTGVLCYANGGHVAPIFTRCQDDPHYKKDLSGPVVGVISGMQYKDISVALQPGEAVFLCTDGVTEAMNEEDKLFGDRRLLEEVARMKDKSCKEVINGILQAVKSHAGKAQQSDDIAMLMIRWGVEDENNVFIQG